MSATPASYLCTENVGLPKASWNDKTKAFVADFQAKHNAMPSGAVMEGYDGAWLLFDADQDARRAPTEGDHPRAGEHQLCRRARQV